jgi:hypothetical protein
MYIEGALSQIGAFNLLYEFSKKRFCNENIEFLMLVRRLNPNLGTAAVDLFPSFCVSDLHKTKYIYRHYVAEYIGGKPNPHQINLPDWIQKDLGEAQTSTMDKYTFDQAYHSILTLSRSDFWLRFVQSPGGRRVGAQIDPSNFAPAAAAVPIPPPPVVFIAPALNANAANNNGAANGNAVVNPAPVVAAAPASTFRRPVLRNNLAAVTVNPNIAPPLPPENQRRVVVAAAAAHPHPAHPALPPLPVPNAAEAAQVAANQATAAAYAAPLPIPAPPAFIVPANVVATRPRAGFAVNRPVALVRRQGERHLNIY